MEDKNEPDHPKPAEDPLRDDEQTFERNDHSDELTEPDEGLIELNDVTEASPEDEKEILKLNDAVDVPSDQDNGIIALTDVVESSDETDTATEAGGVSDDISGEADKLFESEEESLESNIGLEPFDDEMDIPQEPEDDIIKSLGVDLTTEIVGFEEPAALDEDEIDEKPSEKPLDMPDEFHETAVGSDSFSTGQIEAAIERVIVRLYSEKIEGIIVEAIEKAVKKEIEKINILLKGVLEDGK